MLGSGGFGSNQGQQSSGGLFGASTSFSTGIGQQGVSQNINSSIQPSSGLFNSSNSIFSGNNTSSGLFGNIGSSTNVFGATGAASNFGQSSNGLFGQSMGTFSNNQQIGSTQPSIFSSSTGPSTGSNAGFFGSGSTGTSGIFGSFQNSFGSTGGFGNQTSQQNNSTGLFGQQNNTGIFGSTPVQGFGNTSTSPFGSSLGGTNLFGNKKGTNGITFQPLVDRDSDARIMSIVYQKDIDQKKSVDELRWEDYQEKRGPTSSLSTLDTNFSNNSTGNFGSSSFPSNSGIFNSSSQNSSVSNSIFGKAQTGSFLSSTTPQTSLFGGGSSTVNLGQSSLLTQNFQSGQSNLGNSFQFGTNNSNSLFSGTTSNANSSLQTSPNASNTGLFSSSGLFSNNSNNSSLFSQPSANTGVLDNNNLKGTSSFFGAPITTSPSTNLNLFGNNSNTQAQISFGGSLGARSLFDNPQNLNISNNNSSLLGTGADPSSTTGLFGSTQSAPSSLIGTSSSSTGLLFGSSLTQPAGSTINNSSGTIGSNLFGQTLTFSQPNIPNNTSGSLWSNLSSGSASLTTNTNSSTGNNLFANNANQFTNILNGINKNNSNSQGSSISIGMGISNSLSNSGLSKSITQCPKYLDSKDKAKSLWLWKPLPQYISRQNRYQLDGFQQLGNADVTNNNSELALPALATESARHNNLLLSSVRRIEKTVDPQTPATFLTLLERQQQFFDAVQSPESASNSPINMKSKSMVFSTSHASSYVNKFVPIDENFEDAIDDSSSVPFSPKMSLNDNKSILEGTKPLLNLESISRISQDIQFSKKDDTRNSTGRVSIESSVRTPHLNQNRNSLSSSLINGERPARTSVGLTTPRPILRRSDQIRDYSIPELSRSNQNKHKENVVESLTPILTKPDYFCIPSIEVLKTFSEDRLAIVEDFRIIREGVGEIMWPGITDLRGINLDSVVSIEPLCVSVYGEGDSTIPIGEGLNKKAVISLKNCKPKKILSSKDPQDVEDFKNNRVQQIKLYTEQMGARFISLDTITWEWKFEVSHFSRYGLINEESNILTSYQRYVTEDLKSVEMLQSDGYEIYRNDRAGNSSLNLSNPSSRITAKDVYYDHNSLNKGFFDIYQEIKDIMNKEKKMNSIYNVLSFRGSIFLGSNSIIARPHSPPRKESCMSDYNTSITIYRLNQNCFSSNAPFVKDHKLPRRMISAWLRVYLEIIGNPEKFDKDITIESILKLTFLFWDIAKKELVFSSFNSKSNLEFISNLDRLRYIEETFCLVTGIVEVVSCSCDISSQKENLYLSKIEEYVFWWLKVTFNRMQSIDYFVNQEKLKNNFSEIRIFEIFRNLFHGSLRNLILAQNIENYLIFPRTMSLCLSIGNNRSSIDYFCENLRWWIDVGLISDFSTTALKVYRTIADVENSVPASSCWQILLYLFINYSSKYSDPYSKRIQVVLNTLTKNLEEKKMINRNQLRELVKTEDKNLKGFFRSQLAVEDIQFKIIKFFFLYDKAVLLDILSNLHNSSSNIFSFSFPWIITRILTLFYKLKNSENDILSLFPSKLNLMFIQELELLGMWEWGAYIATHLSENNKSYSSNNIFINLIMRNITEHIEFSDPDDYVDSSSWKFLVGTIGIPLTWLLEAMIYKMNSRGNILLSLKFTIYLIEHFHKVKKYSQGDLFFQSKCVNSTQAINILVLFAVERLFDDSLMTRTLIEISTFLKCTAGIKMFRNGMELKSVAQVKVLEKLNLTIANSLDYNPISQDSWKCITLIVYTATKFVNIAVNFLEDKSYTPRRSELKEIGSFINEIISFESMNSHSLIETSIGYVMKSECWKVVNETLEILSNLDVC